MGTKYGATMSTVSLSAGQSADTPHTALAASCIETGGWRKQCTHRERH
jgi:hypothetical protein